MKTGFKIGGIFDVECIGPDGKVKWQDQAKNIVTKQGLDHLLNVVFHGTTPISPWYVGLWGGSSPTTDSTMATPVFTECTKYADTRKEFVEGAASSQSISNTGNAASFAINDTDTDVKGAFICAATSGTTAPLFCAAAFTQGTKSVANGDTVNVTYTLSAADDGA